MSEAEPRPAAPVLRKEVVTTPALGEVVVRALRLSERLALNRDVRTERETTDANDQFCARLLSACVTDKAGVALYTLDEWDIFGATNEIDVNMLIEVALRLGGFDRGEAKND